LNDREADRTSTEDQSELAFLEVFDGRHIDRMPGDGQGFYKRCYLQGYVVRHRYYAVLWNHDMFSLDDCQKEL
jgi:hypothetical protein